MKLSHRILTAASAVAVIAAIATTMVILAPTSAPPPAAVSAPSSHTPTAAATATRAPSPQAPYAAPSPAVVAALPEARYNAVIPQLLGYAQDGVPPGLTAAYTISADAPLYGDDLTAPIARLAATNFLDQSTIVVPVDSRDGWSLVLTPSRRSLPSTDPEAPAQSAAWLRTDLLTKAQDLSARIVISVGEQTVSIVDASGAIAATFPAGVGATDTPTPTGVVGYVQARYLDPAQNQTVYPITLSSLHSAAADEPFGGTDGGLIGVHYYSEREGAISHGCVRVSGDAITALDQLPLGTPIVIEP